MFPLSHQSVHLLFFERIALVPQFLVFSSLPFGLVFHSLLSFGQRYCLKKTGVSVCVCMCLFQCAHKVYIQGDGDKSLFVFFFFFYLTAYVCVCVCACMSPAIFEKCVWIRLCAELLRCDILLSLLSLHRTHLSRQHKEIWETCVTADQQRTCV